MKLVLCGGASQAVLRKSGPTPPPHTHTGNYLSMQGPKDLVLHRSCSAEEPLVTLAGLEPSRLHPAMLRDHAVPGVYSELA